MYEDLVKRLNGAAGGPEGIRMCLEAAAAITDLLVENQSLRNAADVSPVRHGRWVKLDVHKGMEQFKCSECSSECYVPTCLGTPMFDFCPNCGAKMDGE